MEANRGKPILSEAKIFDRIMRITAVYFAIHLISPIVASREYRPSDDDNLKQLLSARRRMQP
jgi:hypothetical protein